MHPVLCLKSRIGNIMSPATQRRDEIAFRQLNAAWWVVRAYIEEALDAGDQREAIDCLRDLLHYARRHSWGKDAHLITDADILDIPRSFLDDTHLDERWRKYTLAPEIEKIERKRESRARRREA